MTKWAFDLSEEIKTSSWCGASPAWSHASGTCGSAGCRKVGQAAFKFDGPFLDPGDPAR